MSHTPEPDPREAYGLKVEPDVTAPYTLVPSHHTTPMTGGVLDYGIGATLNGKRVVIGELFARAPMEGTSEGVHLNTKRIGEQIVDTLNACVGLNPTAYRKCVEALKAIDEETEFDCKPTSTKSLQSDAWVMTPFGRAKSMVKRALAHAEGAVEPVR